LDPDKHLRAGACVPQLCHDGYIHCTPLRITLRVKSDVRGTHAEAGSVIEPASSRYEKEGRLPLAEPALCL